MWNYKCDRCGCALDPGERCDCGEAPADDKEVYTEDTFDYGDYQSHPPGEDCRSVVFLAKAAQSCYTVRGIILALRQPWKTQTTRTPPKYGDYTDEKVPQKTSNNPSAKEWE